MYYTMHFLTYIQNAVCMRACVCAPTYTTLSSHSWDKELAFSQSRRRPLIWHPHAFSAYSFTFDYHFHSLLPNPPPCDLSDLFTISIISLFLSLVFDPFLPLPSVKPETHFSLSISYAAAPPPPPPMEKNPSGLSQCSRLQNNPMCDLLLQSFVSALTLLPLCTTTPQGRLTLQTKQLRIDRHQRPELKMYSAWALPRKCDFHGSFGHYFTCGQLGVLIGVVC